MNYLQAGKVVMAGKKLVERIKNSLAIGSRSPSPEPGASSSTGPSSCESDNPFTRFVLSHLIEQDHKLVAMAFAPQIQTDCEARNLDFDDFFHLLGHTSKRDAVRTLRRVIAESELLLGTSAQNSTGRPRDHYMLSVNQFEEVLLAANTDAGKRWRKLVLRIKNLVVQYMKLEMEKKMSQLAIKDEKLEELEAVQTRLHATLEAQAARQAKKDARKAQQKTPLEKNYLTSNSPGSTGPFKLGKTGSDGKKRAKEMQTGNHEKLTVVFEIACTDSLLIEKAAQHIFYDYRINDKLEWFDAPKDSLSSVLTFLVETIDGLRRVDHDEVRVDGPLEIIVNGFHASWGSRRDIDRSSDPEAQSTEANGQLLGGRTVQTIGLGDLLTRFLTARCEVGRTYELFSTELLEKFNAFLEAEDRSEQVTPQSMVKLMDAKGHKVCNVGPRKKTRGYIGLRLR